MKDNGNENISICFVIEPIHQKNKRKDTNDEVQTIKPSPMFKLEVQFVKSVNLAFKK